MAKILSCSFKYVVSLGLLAMVTQANAAPLFSDDTVIDVEIIGPLSSVIKDKKDREELPFVLRANGVDHSIKLRVRGKSRTRVCDFPPLRIRFSDDDTDGTIFAGQNKLKLVTQCQKDKSARANVLEEFAAYRIFNVISDISFKVRLLHVRYTDTGGRLQDGLVEQLGFLIESKTSLADRLGAEPVALAGIKRSSLDGQQAAAVFVFQYLIANTDWSLVAADDEDECCHNGELFKAATGLYYVPYDFDLSGLVNAHYASPDRSLGMRSVTQRRYRGYCVPPDTILSSISRINAMSSDILRVPSEIPGMEPRNIAASVKFLQRFFAQAEDEEKLTKSFDKRCL
jgi:hypothetical protein